MPVGDLARDAGALFLLFGSLALPWESGHQASDRWWVVLATIAAALSLALPYLTTARVIPGWGGPQVRLAKLAACAPYAVCLLVVVINELINLTDEFAGGIGTGVGVGLAGVLLVLQPRAVEDDATAPNRAAWHRTSVLLATAGLVLVALGTVIFVISNIGDANDSVLSFLGVVLLLVGANALVVILPLAPYATRSRPAARVFATVGFSLLAVAFLATVGDGDSSFYDAPLTKITGEGFFGPAPTGYFLITAAAALAVARAVLSTLKPIERVASWVQTASLAFVVAAAGLALSAVGRLLIIVDTETYEASTIVPLVLMVGAVIAALVARTLTQTNADLHRGVVIAITGAIVLVAIVAIAVGNSGASTDSLTASEAVGWFAMPGLVLWSLLVPAPVRTTFKPLANTPPTKPPPAA